MTAIDLDEATAVQLVDAAIEKVKGMHHLPSTQVDVGGRGPAGRDFSIAVTHLEDAQMRITRGLAKSSGRFAPADLEAKEVSDASD